MTTTQDAKRIPTAKEAKTHPLLGTIRNAALAAARDGQTRYVWATYMSYALETTPRPDGRYFEVTADTARKVGA